ncbi:enoyl-CoA hydratase/isomerase family protein [Phycicoccus sp. DTK01]|uniref:enoyl-CoA hydratase/isomerase family protein n=1 Tax=Phycicoccus sp. DTK01 TaxID=2785745 RepID=UPI001A8DAC84|nr:enoyl-CoA hydratase-related protein [Phycicoccus sp. DTK01]GIL34128.1 enoyl-CoA hydratase [Phycicoccus sp. DTK01]
MGPFEAIAVAVEDGVGTITLDQPDRRNPLDRTMSGELVEAFSGLFADDAVRVVVLRANGPAFCAGGDLRQMGRFSQMPTAEAFDWPGRIVELNRLMLAATKPVLAAVDGPAFAGGMGLAGMCDVLLATPQARFAMPEVKVGIFPMIIVAQLSRSIPRKHLLEMMFTGDAIDAAEAYRLGFVNRVYPDAAALDEGVKAYAERFKRASPSAVRLGRRAFNLLSEMTADQALDAAQFFVMPFHLGDDIVEGADAFLERRPPRWADPTSGDAHA